MATKKTAPVASKPVRKGPTDIKGVTIVRMPRGAVDYPAAVYRGTAPAKGETLRFELDNGVTYAGKVHDVTEADGEVLAEFVDGIAPEGV